MILAKLFKLNYDRNSVKASKEKINSFILYTLSVLENV